MTNKKEDITKKMSLRKFQTLRNLRLSTVDRISRETKPTPTSTNKDGTSSTIPELYFWPIDTYEDFRLELQRNTN